MTYEQVTEYWTATYTGRGEFYSGIQTGDKVSVEIRGVGSRYAFWYVRSIGGGPLLSLPSPESTGERYPLADMTFVREVREVLP